MKREHVIVCILLAFFFVSGLFYAATNSITSDELTHVTAGYLNVHFNDYRFNIEHPPLVKQLAALPLLLIKLNFPLDIYHAASGSGDIVGIQDAFLFKRENNLDLMLLLTRLPNILIAVMLGVFIYMYSKRLNGAWAGIVSLSLFILSPSFLGHSPLVTMDTTISCFYFVTVYFLMRFFETRRNLYLSLTGIFLGLALVSKFSALVLIPVLYVLFAAYIYISGDECIDVSGLKRFLFLLPLLPLTCSYKSSFKFVAPALIAFLLSSILYKRSKKLMTFSILLLIVLTIALSIIIIDYTDFKWFPLHGATKAYFKGFSSFEGHAKGGQGDSYLLGMHSTRGWWYYFPLAIIFKEPISFLVLFLLGLWSFFQKKEDMISKALLLVPALAYLFVSMFINKVNIGVRHILPVFPFLYVMAGYCVVVAERFKFIKYALYALLIVLAVDVLTAYPAHMSYVDRAIGGTDSGYKFLSDSNLGWGQDWKRAKEYLGKNNIGDVAIQAAFSDDKNCGYYKIPYRPLTRKEFIVPNKGYYIIEINELASGNIKWLRKIRPLNRIGGSLLLYNITDKDINNLKVN